MRDHQFSIRFKKDTDIDFKNTEFERKFSDYLVGFIQCYPHLIEKVPADEGYEFWIFKFEVYDDKP